MSLPRADYDPRRVCVNPCPNVTLGLGKQKRTVGVYLAGALVRSPSLPIHKRILNSELISYFSSVLFSTHACVYGRSFGTDLMGNSLVELRAARSSLSPIGRSSMQRSSPRTFNPHMRRNQCWCTSRSSTGSREFALFSACSSST